MFDDLTLEELTALRADLRSAYQLLLKGEKTVEVHYGELGEKFHAADIAKLEGFLASVVAEINRRNGCSGGGFVVVTG